MFRRTKFSRFRRRLRQWRRIFSLQTDAVVMSELLSQFAAATDLPERMDLLRQIVHWLFVGGADQVDVRFRFLFRILESRPEWKASFARTLDKTVRECSFFRFFTEIGMTVEHGLWADISGRMLAKIVIQGDHRDFAQVFHETTIPEVIKEGLSSLSPRTLAGVKKLVVESLSGEAVSHLSTQKREAEAYLAIHVAHYGLSHAIQRRVDRPYQVSTSPFFQISAVIQEQDKEKSLNLIAQCETELANVYRHLNESGVSIDVVNRVETIGALLRRLGVLLEMDSEVEGVQPYQQFMIAMVEAGERARSITGHLKRSFYLLSRKIVERNGNSGEHYIARNSLELRNMFMSAIGGGIIVVFMTMGKLIFLKTDPAPLISAVGLWIIYAGGFVGMQLTGATLATKIPSFTASRLAEFLRSARNMNIPGFNAEVRQTLISQVVALVGNLVGLVPLVLLVNMALDLSVGRGLLTSDYANHVIEDLHPFLSFAIPLGALTGLQLWLSSVAGGWFENWMVFNRIPEGVAENYRLRKVLGEESARKISDWMMAQSSGLATNIALGFLFGFTPLFGAMLGFNWHSNHVTISTSSAVFAFSTLKFQLPWSEIAYTMVGLMMIGVMNFGVSFMMALFIACSARRMQLWRMLYYLRKTFSKSPPV